MFVRPVHTLQSATSGWRDWWLNTWSKTLSVLFSTAPISLSLDSSSLVIDYWGNHRNLWQTGLRGDNNSSLSEEQLSNCLGELQFSKIKSLANFFLSLSESTQINRTYASVDGFRVLLRWLSRGALSNRQRINLGAATRKWWRGRRIYRQRSLGAKLLKWPDVTAWHLSATVIFPIKAQLYLRSK